MALLEAGANPSAPDSDGNTLLHLVESTDFMAALLKHESDLEAINKVNRFSLKSEALTTRVMRHSQAVFR